MKIKNLCDDCLFDSKSCESTRFRDSEGNVYSCSGYCNFETGEFKRRQTKNIIPKTYDYQEGN